MSPGSQVGVYLLLFIQRTTTMERAPHALRAWSKVRFAHTTQAKLRLDELDEVSRQL